VDGQPVTASLLQHKEEWLEICVELPEARVSVSATVPEPENFALIQLTNGNAYGFDLSAELQLGEAITTSRLVLPLR
jgi:hypothetical protein